MGSQKSQTRLGDWTTTSRKGACTQAVDSEEMGTQAGQEVSPRCLRCKWERKGLRRWEVPTQRMVAARNNKDAKKSEEAAEPVSAEHRETWEHTNLKKGGLERMGDWSTERWPIQNGGLRHKEMGSGSERRPKRWPEAQRYGGGTRVRTGGWEPRHWGVKRDQSWGSKAWGIEAQPPDQRGQGRGQGIHWVGPGEAAVRPCSAASRILPVNSLTLWSLVSSSATSSGRPGPCTSILQNSPDGCGRLLVRMLCSTTWGSSQPGSRGQLSWPGIPRLHSIRCTFVLLSHARARLPAAGGRSSLRLLSATADGAGRWSARVASVPSISQLLPYKASVVAQVTRAHRPPLVSFGSLLGVTPVQLATRSPQAASFRAQPMPETRELSLRTEPGLQLLPAPSRPSETLQRR